MIIRQIDQDGDWIFGSGLNSYAILNDAIGINIKTKLLEWKNDCFFNNTAGIDWLTRLGVGQRDLLELDIKGIILKAFGVVSLNELSLNVIDRNFTISFDVQTIYTESVKNIITI